MYYVSRINEAGHVFITDTEDNVEEYLTRAQIQKLVSAGVEIKGVDANINYKGILTVTCNVALPPSVEKARLMLSQGIDIGVNSEGVAVSFNAINQEGPKRSFVLSDYCKKVGANMVVNSQHNIIFIFDDKLESVSHKWCASCCIVYVDVTNVTRPDLMINILKGVGEFGLTSVIDNHGRLPMYNQVVLMQLGREIELRGGEKFYDDFVVQHCKTLLLRQSKKIKELMPRKFVVRFGSEDSYRAILSRLFYRQLNSQFAYQSIMYLCKNCGVNKVGQLLAYRFYGGADPELNKEAKRIIVLMADSYGWLLERNI